LPSQWSNLEVHLEGSQNKSGIPIEDASVFLNRLQTLVNHIGDYLTGSDYRSRGRSPQSVRDRCTLVFKKVEVGSLTVQLRLEDSQTTLTNTTTLGEDSVKTFHDLMHIVERGNDVEKKVSSVIDNPLHRNRIVEDMVKIWPRADGTFSAKIKLRDEKALFLNPSRKLLLEGLLQHVAPHESTVKGVLGMVRVVPDKLMKIIGPDGQIQCTFPKNLESEAVNFIGKPVIVNGEASFDAEGNVKEVVSVSRIRPFNSLTVQRILSSKGQELVLSESLVISVDYEDDSWIMKNDELGIVAMNRDYDETVNEFNDEFAFVWKQYGSAPDNKLTDDAKQLKNKIVHYVKSGAGA